MNNIPAMYRIRPLVRLFALVFCMSWVATTPAWAQKNVPAPTQFLVNDFAGLLSRQEVVALGQKLRDYAAETSTQIVVVTETSLEGDDAFEYVQRLATTWGIGGGENSNGVLLYVAKDDRQVRIQTGYGTEGFLPDVTAKRIIDGIITPAFRQGRYYDGLNRATDAIMDLGRGEYTGGGGARKSEEVPGWIIIVFLMAFILLVSWWTHRNPDDDDDDDDGGYYRGGRYDMPRHRRRGGTIIIPGGFGGGGFGGGGFGGGDGWGGFGGGGFGGFGGGGFGGGGAGGSW